MIEKKSLHCPNCGASVSPDCVCCTYCGSTLTIAACPSCFGSVFKGMKHCPHCGEGIDRRIVDGGKPLDCPKCAIPLQHVMVGDVPLCECGTCGGLWLDSVTLERLCEGKEDQEKVLAYDSGYDANTQSTNEDNSNEPLKGGDKKVPWRYVPCPECGELMLRKNFLGCSGIIVDWCKAHGTWFDHRELQGIVEFIRGGGMVKVRDKELSKLKEEQDRLKEMKFQQELDSFRNLQMDTGEKEKETDIFVDLLGVFMKFLKS